MLKQINLCSHIILESFFIFMNIISMLKNQTITIIRDKRIIINIIVLSIIIIPSICVDKKTFDIIEHAE